MRRASAWIFDRSSFALVDLGALVRWVFADFGIARRFALLLVAISPASFLEGAPNVGQAGRPVTLSKMTV
jgi:hypothetical protein